MEFLQDRTASSRCPNHSPHREQIASAGPHACLTFDDGFRMLYLVWPILSNINTGNRIRVTSLPDTGCRRAGLRYALANTRSSSRSWWREWKLRKARGRGDLRGMGIGSRLCPGEREQRVEKLVPRVRWPFLPTLSNPRAP